MERDPAPKTLPDVSPDERASSELLKRIRKLRWIGMEHEAQQLQAKLNGDASVQSYYRNWRPIS